MKAIVRYTSGYRYRLEQRYSCPLQYIPPNTGGNAFVWIDADGNLLIEKNYAWDGASGPAINTKNFVRGSLVHDALYQLIREGILPASYRKDADKILRQIVLEDGMWQIRALWVYAAVRMFGQYHMDNHSPRIRIAP